MQTKCGTVAILGAPNAGKSTILNALLGEKIAPTSPRPQTTRRLLRGVLTRSDTQIIFIDTPGMLKPAYELQDYMQKQAQNAILGVDVILFVVDVTNKANEKTSQILELILSMLREARVPVILVLNKIDQLADKKLLLPIIKDWQAKYSFKTIVPASATMNDGLDVLEAQIASLLPNADFIFPKDILTDTSERDLVADLIREKAMLFLGEEVPYQVAVTIEEFDESRRSDTKKNLVTISAVLHVERESQKAIVIGKGGSKLKEIGAKARKDIERLIGCQVMLKLFVKVEPLWTKSPKSLRKLGYK